MFALCGLVPLLVFLYLRPQEVIPALRALPMLNLMTALCALGLVIDLRLGRTRISPTPILRWLVLWVLWGGFCTFLRGGGNATDAMMAVLILTTELLLVSHAVTSFRTLQIVTATLLALGLTISAVCLHQAHQPFGCFAIKDAEDRELTTGRYDGRPCETRQDCYLGNPEPGTDYTCEKPGLFNTSSVGHGRVRYRGILQDPNYAALAIAIVIPLAFAFWQMRRTIARGLLAGATTVMVGWTIIYTQSRGGQLVFLATLGAYFVRRFGFGAGGALGLVAAVPVMLLGGRSGEEADSSEMERIDILSEGVQMVREQPVLGVGVGQFSEHCYMTAHNAYLLCTAEIGFPGFFLWITMIYLSIKTLVLALQRYEGVPEARAASTWAMALLASMIGLLVGIFFLSFTYHPILYIYLGLCGAFYSACKRHDPGFTVRYSLREAALLAAGNVALIIGIGLYARWKGA